MVWLRMVSGLTYQFDYDGGDLEGFLSNSAKQHAFIPVKLPLVYGGEAAVTIAAQHVESWTVANEA